MEEKEKEDKKAIVERVADKDFGPIKVSRELAEGVSVGGVKMGGFVTKEEFEKYKKRVLSRPLP